MKGRKLSAMLLGIGGLLAMVAYADTPQGYDQKFLKEAGAMELGPLRLYPALQTSVGYDDNIFESANNVESSRVTRAIPELSAVLGYDLSMLQVGYQADNMQYAASSADNFTDQLFFLRGHAESGFRHRLNLDIKNNRSHEARGTGLSEGFDPVVNASLTSPDAFTDNTANLGYEFGARTAPGNLRFALSYLDHQYDNHRERTAFSDRTEAGAGATFLWRVFPRTSLAFEARTRRISYADTQPGQSSLDSRERDLLVGAEWEVTGKTSGAARIGNKAKNFDASERSDGSNLAWEVSAKWSPRTYSHFELALDRSPKETNGAGDFIDTRTYSLRWQHQWLDRVETRAAISRDDQSYQNTSRSQQTQSVQFGVGYEMYRWLTWRVTGEWRDRSSNINQLEFTRNRYGLTAEFHL